MKDNYSQKQKLKRPGYLILAIAVVPFLAGCSSTFWTPETKPSLADVPSIKAKFKQDNIICSGYASRGVPVQQSSSNTIVVYAPVTNSTLLPQQQTFAPIDYTIKANNPVKMFNDGHAQGRRMARENQIYNGIYADCMINKGWVLRSQEEYDSIQRPIE
jgi:hypothetical protein